MTRTTNELEELEQLDVIESSTLKVGNAFHAFRFKVSASYLGEDVMKTLEAAVEKLVKEKGITRTEAVKQIEEAANLGDALSKAAKKVAKIK
jgi:hypothetical protein